MPNKSGLDNVLAMFLSVLMHPIFPFSQATDLVSIRERLGACFSQIKFDFLKHYSANQALSFIGK